MVHSFQVLFGFELHNRRIIYIQIPFTLDYPALEIFDFLKLAKMG